MEPTQLFSTNFTVIVAFSQGHMLSYRMIYIYIYIYMNRCTIYIYIYISSMLLPTNFHSEFLQAEAV